MGGLLAALALFSFQPVNAATQIKIDAGNLLVTVDPTACRWSADVNLMMGASSADIKLQLGAGL